MLAPWLKPSWPFWDSGWGWENVRPPSVEREKTMMDAPGSSSKPVFRVMAW
jgi:hypothetical protein